MESECDIILLSYENPLLLKKCVMSILEHTRTRSTLIVVDNGSRDPEVKKYLDKIHGNDIVDIEKVFCEENTGFAKGMNKGLRLADAPFVCLLNNDCVVTGGWIEEMISVAETRADIGLVNPQSSTFGSYPDHSVLINEHAKLLTDKKGRYVELGHAIGFACLIKREVIDKIGYLDEAYEGVCYEDTDFSVRAHNAGYISVMAEGAYVFHKEQASRRGLEGKEEIYSRNKKIFEDRWGKLIRVLYMDNTRDIYDQVEVKRDYEALKGLARQRVAVHVWIMDRYSTRKGGAGLDNVEADKHADISIELRLPRLVRLQLLWALLAKKKKYDAVILQQGFIARLAGFFGSFRGTEIFILRPERLISGKSGDIFDLKKPAPFVEYLRKNE
ncbi:MAG: glycosyltransferase family 2 protein [Candidatus Omnitrophica bacterium]|nr:glycosyltransferase family 2 protein [Candidatus Omnitrophota bacterium]MBU1128556.1 glycosyltransferase family 2 protein [Candidatus Omnitrophota bacterium]MBU1783736.1 glycosyltransferase family 2 protein [Candidatus Omnitrophota bacterium]MBU1851733.1 glycosyltransferase family 2 protein [Candidatus Omnitrophota bacterium]